MNRFAVVVVAAAVLGFGVYFAWPRLYPPASTVQHFDGVTPDGKAPLPNDPTETALVELNDEFFKHKAIKPSTAARKRIQELAALGPKGNKMVVILDDWLRQMFDGAAADSEEFRELAQALLAVEPHVPYRVVKRHYDTYFDVDMEYSGKELMAFGKAALPAVLQGLRDEADHEKRLALPAKSRLPAVLAQLGEAALPGIAIALEDESPHVRGQALRALTLMSREQAAGAVPLIRRLADGDPHAATQEAARVLLSKIERQ